MNKGTKKAVVNKEPEINMVEAIEQLAKEKHIDVEIIYSSIRDGIMKVYEKKFDPDAELDIEFDRVRGEIKISKRIRVVKKVEDELLEIGLNEAKAKYGEHITIDDIVNEPVDSREFSRLAVILGSQIIKQNIREAEKDSILKEFGPCKGEIMYGDVFAIEDSYILIAVDRTYAFLPTTNCIPGDNFKIGDKICFLAEDVIKSKNAGQIKASRTANEFLTKLLEMEVTEMVEGIVQVKSVARNPGVRSKIAVSSSDPTIVPIGACVGQNGTRINIVSEKLNGEKIDVCLWSDDETQFIINALAPVKVVSITTEVEEVGENVYTNDEGEEIVTKKFRKEANVIVPDAQYSLAIGKKGSSAKLVAKLTKWKLNIMSQSQAIEQEVPLLWNGNIRNEEMEDLAIRLEGKVREKDINYKAKMAAEKIHSPLEYDEEVEVTHTDDVILAPDGDSIIEEQIIVSEEQPEEIEELHEGNIMDEEDLEQILEESSFLEKKDNELRSEDDKFYENINYDDYDEYYDK